MIEAKSYPMQERENRNPVEKEPFEKRMERRQKKFYDKAKEMSPSEIMQDELEPIIHKPKDS